MKLKRALSVIISLIIFLLMPSVFVGIGFFLPAQYGSTYYAVLPRMFQKLKATEGKKLVVIGNSALAFALEPQLIESEIDGYSVCPFGLYGAIGTKAMIDLSRVNIGKGDIVVLAPELLEQSLSLYFNGDYLWNAVDGDLSMLRYIKNGENMAATFVGYAGRKFNYYIHDSAPEPQDVYAAASFNEACKMIYDRPYNVLPLKYDAVNRISYEAEIFSPDFASYVNEFNEYVTARGAELLFGFTPVNAQGIALNTTQEDIYALYDAIDGLLDCELLGNPLDYILDSDWFYDANVHVNSAGAVVYTDRLVRDLKAHLNDSSPVEIELPAKPQVPELDEVKTDGKDAALFTYEALENGWHITGLTSEGKAVTNVELPNYYQGKKVVSFDASVFAGNTVIEELHLGKYIYTVEGGAFDGCTSLRRLYVSKDVQPSNCIVYLDLLKGAPNCKIYVPQEKLLEYINDYFWSRYGAYIMGY